MAPRRLIGMLCLCLLLGLSACGNKGPLQLPDEDEKQHKRERKDY